MSSTTTARPARCHALHPRLEDLEARQLSAGDLAGLDLDAASTAPIVAAGWAADAPEAATAPTLPDPDDAPDGPEPTAGPPDQPSEVPMPTLSVPIARATIVAPAAFVVAAAVPVPAAAAPAAMAPAAFVGPVAPAPTLQALAADPLLARALYSSPNRMASGIAADGAVSENAEWEAGTSTAWYIEEQRYGADFVQAGLARGDAGLKAQGWQMIEWGFAHQSADGGFAGTGDAYHSTSMFVEAAARALLLEKQSGDADYAALSARYAAKIQAAAGWLMRPDVAATGQKNDAPFGHRRWLLAAALGEAAALSGDAATAAAAAAFARQGIAIQQADGMTPERGGGDSSYQAYGALLAGRYATVCDDPALLASVRANVALSLKWEATRIDAAGNVSTADNTRTGVEVGVSGQAKTVDYKTIVQAYSVGAGLLGDASLESVAANVAQGRRWIKAGS